MQNEKQFKRIQIRVKLNSVQSHNFQMSNEQLIKELRVPNQMERNHFGSGRPNGGDPMECPLFYGHKNDANV